MTDAEMAVLEILTWVREVTSDSPALRPIGGHSELELKQLARLAVLIRGRVGGAASRALADALTPDAPIEPSADAVSALDRLIDADDPVVHLASLYAAIVQPSHRRRLGTFFTPRDSATAIVTSYADRHGPPAVVVDVGAGVGIFSEIARAQWPDAHILAIDINPVTLGLQAVATAGRSRWNVQLELADYQVWLEGDMPTSPTLYLGNPPYTRWQLLDLGDRAKLVAATDGLVGSRANLSTLFLGMTLAKLREEDSLAMIIPAGWMRADYGKNLRSYLRAASHRRVCLRLADSWRFDEAIVDAVSVEVGPRAATPQPIEVSDWSGSERLRIARLSGADHFPAPGRTHAKTTSSHAASARLGDLARVSRGTASGANDFFVKSPLGWEGLNIPARFRYGLARRLRPGTDAEPHLQTAEMLVLDGYERGAHPHVEYWIKAGEAKGVPALHLCARRKNWFDLSGEVKTPDVIVSSLARERFHILPNLEALAITNNLFGLDWKPGVDQTTKQSVIAWLRSVHGQAALRASSSVEANGLHRLSPRAVEAICVTITGTDEVISSVLPEPVTPLAGGVD